MMRAPTAGPARGKSTATRVLQPEVGHRHRQRILEVSADSAVSIRPRATSRNSLTAWRAESMSLRGSRAGRRGTVHRGLRPGRPCSSSTSSAPASASLIPCCHATVRSCHGWIPAGRVMAAPSGRPPGPARPGPPRMPRMRRHLRPACRRIPPTPRASRSPAAGRGVAPPGTARCGWADRSTKDRKASRSSWQYGRSWS